MLNLTLFLILVSLSLIVYYYYVLDLRLLKKVTQLHRGTWSERNLVLKLLKNGFPPETIFHDLYIKKRNGNYSQIDLVVITQVGVIVVEVKHFSGWVYGVGNREKWVQLFNYGKEKHQFYNPIFQNEQHIQSLKNQLTPFNNIPFYSLIVFYGSCKLKKISNIPVTTKIVYSHRVIQEIKSLLQNSNLSPRIDTTEIYQILKEGVRNGENKEIQKQHILYTKNIQK
jgi:hypothetical protein